MLVTAHYTTSQFEINELKYCLQTIHALQSEMSAFSDMQLTNKLQMNITLDKHSDRLTQAIINRRLNRFEEARQGFKELISSFDNSQQYSLEETLRLTQCHHQLASLEAYLGNYFIAMQHIEKALDLWPSDDNTPLRNKIDKVEMLLLKADIYSEQGQLKRTQDTLKDASRYYNKHKMQVYGLLYKIHFIFAKFYYASDRPYLGLAQCQRALTICEKHYGRQHATVGIVYKWMARNWSLLYKLDDAVDYMQNAININRREFSIGHCEIGKDFFDMADIYINNTQINEALAYQVFGLKILENYYPSAHPDLATAYHNIAQSYREKGEFGKALTYHQLAIDKINKCESKMYLLGQFYESKGNTYRKLKDYNNAFVCLDKAEKITSSFYDFPLLLARIYNTQATVLLEQRNYSEALKAYEAAYQRLKEYAPHDFLGHIIVTRNIALCRIKLFQTEMITEIDRVLAEIKKVEKISRKMYREDHPIIGGNYSKYGDYYYALAEKDINKVDNLTLAIEYYKKAANNFEGSLYKKTSRDLAYVYSNLALAYKLNGQFKEALYFFKKSLEMRQQIEQENNIRKIDNPNSMLLSNIAY